MTNDAVTVRAGKNTYRAIVGSNLLSRFPELFDQEGPGERCAIISDTNVAPLFGDRLKQTLTAAGFRPALWHFKE